MKNLILPVNLLYAGLSWLIYREVFFKGKSPELQLLEMIPAYESKKKELFRDAGEEAVKIIGIYFTLLAIETIIK